MRERESSVLEQSFQIKEGKNFQMREREKGWRIKVEKEQKGQKGVEQSKVLDQQKKNKEKLKKNIQIKTNFKNFVIHSDQSSKINKK